MCPATVTWCSCIASSSAACVFGGVRLISSARMIWAKMGPSLKVRVRWPLDSSRISVPVMSAGMRSGVNWMRLNGRSRMSARALMSRVLASPGTPVIRQCPPVNRAVRTRSMASSWPTITRRSSPRMRSRLRARSRAAATAASAAAESPAGGAGGVPTASTGSAGTSAMRPDRRRRDAGDWQTARPSKAQRGASPRAAGPRRAGCRHAAVRRGAPPRVAVHRVSG